jgi:hypothetical protein
MEFVCCAPNTPNPLCWFDLLFFSSHLILLYLASFLPLSMHGPVRGPFLGLSLLRVALHNKSDLPTPILLVVLPYAWSCFCFCQFLRLAPIALFSQYMNRAVSNRLLSLCHCCFIPLFLGHTCPGSCSCSLTILKDTLIGLFSLALPVLFPLLFFRLSTCCLCDSVLRRLPYKYSYMP